LFPETGRFLLDMDFDLEALLANMGRLWTQGVGIDWAAFYENEPFGRVPLPARPFERKRYWIDVDRPEADAATSVSHSLRRELDAAEGSANIRILADFVQREIARILGSPTLPDSDGNLFEMGIDSLILIEVAAGLSSELERTVAPSSFVDHFTIRKFATNLAGMLRNPPLAEKAPAKAASL
jgi:hypothetical protein